MSYNTPKIINVFYKEDRKPYDVNGKAISYFGEDFIGANDATKIRFYFLPNQALSGLTGIVHAKRADGELKFEILTKSSTPDPTYGNYFELTLNSWFALKVGKVTLSLKVYSGTPTYGLTEGVITSIESVAGLTIIASDIFSFNVGYAPNATEVVPPFEDGEFEQLLVALGDKPDFGETIYVVSALPTLTGDVFDNQWFLVKGTNGNIGKLFHINGSTAEEVELGVEQLNLTPSGNGDVVSGDVRGQVKWNADLGTISFGLYDDVEIGAGDTLFWFVKAQSDIAKGDVVQFAGNVGGEVLVKKAVFSQITAQPDLLMGVAKHAIIAGNKGYIISAGRLNNINTSGFTTPILYLSTTTAGLLTSTKPTSGFKGSISAVGRFSTSGSNGFLLVRPNLIKGVGELTDVTFTSVANGDVLEYQNGQWINGTFVKNQLNLLGNEVFTLQSEMDAVEGRLDVVEPIVEQHTTDISDLDERIDFIEDNGGIDFIKVADFASLPTSGDVRNHRLFLTQDTNKLYEFDGTSFNEVRQDKLTSDLGEENGLVEVTYGTQVSYDGIADANALQVVYTGDGDGSIIEAVNADGIQFAVNKDGSVNAYGDLTIAGNLTVSGTTTTVNTQTLDVEDNIITINKNQTGTPETTLLSGIEVERGDQTNFQFVFQESSDLFKVGQVGDLQAVATREDSPTDKGVAFFNTSTNKFETSGNLKVNTSGQLEDVTIRNSAVGVSPLTINAIASTSANLAEFKLNNLNRMYVENGGMIRTSEGIANISTSNNSRILLGDTGTIVRRNIADSNSALKVNQENASSTGNIVDFQNQGGNVAFINRAGTVFAGGGFSNLNSINNAYLALTNNGPIINRNIADSNPSLIVNLSNASSTGNIANFQFAGANKLEVTKDGFLTQNGTRLFHQTGGISNTFFGNENANLTLTGYSNSVFGNGAFISATSGFDNSAFGWYSLRGNTTGSGNSAIGTYSGRSNTTGTNNTFVGLNSGHTGAWGTQLASASNSTALGNQAVTDKSNQMVFGNASVTEFKFDRNASAVALLPRAIFSSSTFPTVEAERLVSTTNTSASSVRFITTTSANMVDGFGAGAVFAIKDDSAVINNIGAITAVRSGADNSGRLVVETANAGTLTEKMTIMPNGNVGIGTTSPDSRLHLQAPVDVSSVITLDLNDSGNSIVLNQEYGAINWKGNDGQGNGVRADIRVFGEGASGETYMTFGTRTGGNTSFPTTANERMRITATGNVGVGTASPAQKLDVVGDIRSTFNSNNFSQLESNTSGGVLKAVANGVENVLIRSYGNAHFNGGNVGIGTTNPTDKLHIVNNTADTGITLERTSTTTGKYTFAIKSNGNFEIGESGVATRFLIEKTTGNVGIGTTSPALLLSVVSASNDNGIRIRRNSTTTNDYSTLSFMTNTSDDSVSHAEIRGVRTNRAVTRDTDLTFLTRTNGSLVERLRIRDDGNVGIGTTSPTEPLEVVRNGTTLYASGRFKNSSSTALLDVGVGGSAVGLTWLRNASYVLSGGNTHLVLGTNTSERIRIDGSGLVGINETSATAQLQVKSGATNRVPLIVDTVASPTADLQQWKYAGNLGAYVDVDGNFFNENGTYGTISDRKLKENIIDSRNYLEDLTKLRVVKYSLKEEQSKEPTHLGFIAQEFEQVFPKMIGTFEKEVGKDKDGEPITEEFKSIKMSVLIPMLVKSIQELKAEIEELKKR